MARLVLENLIQWYILLREQTKANALLTFQDSLDGLW